MSCLTKLFHHTGTTSPTDVGPASGGVLHSLIALPITSEQVTVKDGGSNGTIIVAGGDSQLSAIGQLQWKGIKLNGQLNITLANANSRVIVEMSELPS